MSIAQIIFEIILLIIALIASWLAVNTCIKVFRLRNKRLSWRAGTLAGYPLFATIFLIVSMILMGVVCAYYNSSWKIAYAAIYMVISGTWFVTSYYSSKHYITDYGIVKNINEPSQTIAWHQISDFFEQSSGHQRSFIFLYHVEDENFYIQIVRLRLQIPEKKLDTFKKLVSHKLGHRINCFNNETIDINEFEDI